MSLRPRAPPGCHERIQLQFEFETEAERENSLHKVDTLIAALRVFRAGVEAEQAECPPFLGPLIGGASGEPLESYEFPTRR